MMRGRPEAKRTWRLTEQERASAAFRYRRGEKVSEIAADFGVTFSTIVKNARRRGIAAPRRTHPRDAAGRYVGSAR
jgi:transposase-like protein